MRIGGLASGIDTDSIIKDLMKAERIPLDKMEQDKQKLEWERDAFREINTMLFDLDEMAFDLKLERNFKTKSFHSSQEGAVTARGGAASGEGIYKIDVKELATSAMNIGKKIENADEEIENKYLGNKYEFYTYDEDGKQQTHTFEVKEGDTIRDVIKRINDDKDNNVRMFYDELTNKVVMETTRTGDYNSDTEENGGYEIVFNNEFFTQVLNLSQENEKGGTNANITYNGHHIIQPKDNNYTINGITFEFHAVTDGNANISVQNDVDATIEKITEFVDKYNEAIEKINDEVREARYRDYPPLTEAQREEMEDHEIELWEEKAKSGILKGDSILSAALTNLRQNWYATVNTGGEYTSLPQVGISTTSDYMDGGQLEINEDQLREALETDPESVFKLFSNSEDGNSRGLLNRLEDTFDSTMKRINERAGKGTDTLENYTLGKRMKDVDNQISAFEDRLARIENRYWRQFSQMEQAISMMNQQSTMLMSSFMPQQ